MVRGLALLRRLSLLAALVLVAAACNGIGEEISEEEQEVREAISGALPDLETYELAEVDEAEVRERLQQEIGSGDDQPVYVTLPILRANGEIQDKTWTAYHVNVRNIQPVYTDDFITREGAVEVPLDEIPQGPSSTFQGVPPDLTAQEVQGYFQERGEVDESVLQPSVLNLIGDRIEGAYYGGPDLASSYVIESLQTVLEPELGIEEAARLAGQIPENYLIYRHDDFQPPVEHDEGGTEFDVDPQSVSHDHGDHEHALDAESVDPQLHTQTQTLRPVMVADSTVYDPDTNTWLVSNWFDRVDAAANRQNAFLWLANIERDIPSSESSLSTDNNRVFVKTEVGGYLVLTEHGKNLITPYPSTTCGGSGSYIDVVRGLSGTSNNIDNEYWMWWTTNYGGGCGYISTLDRTPRNGAVAWSGYGSGTVDWTSYIFMHESGHVIGGTHRTNSAASPETEANHRCEFLGFWEFGPTGPSVMSYASGTRTYCLAQSPYPFDTATDDVKNLTQVAEFLHNALTTP